MAERYETKLTVRPLSERKPAASAESDPLFELTRMVTGRSTFDPAPAGKSKTVPAAAGPAAATVSTLATDLESELLSDLQASFAAVRESVAAPPPAAAPVTAPAPAATIRPPATVSFTPAARPQPMPSAPPSAERTVRPEQRPAAPTLRAERPAPASVAPSVRPAAPASAPEAASPSQTLADRPSLFRSGNGPTVDLSHLQMRTTTPAAPVAAEAPPVARQAAVPRWAPPAAAPADVPSRFAPPRGTDTGLADEFDAEDELPLADEPAVDDEFTLEDMSALPEYGDDAEIPPFPEDELAGLSRRRTNRGLFLIAGVLVVALAGGLAYVMLSDGKSTSTPPIIAADTTPTKVIPDPSAAAVDSAKESDRVEATDNASDTKLTTPGQVEIAAIPSATEPTNPISRVIIPGGPGFDAPTADDGTSDASGPGQIGPKKVRTVVVRPDGTIVSSEAAAPADAGAPPPAAVTPPAAEVTPPVAPTPPADVAAAAPAPQTGMETVLDGQDGSIPVDTDPLSAGKPTKPEPGTVPASEAVKPPPAAAQVVAVESAKEPVPKPEVRPAKPVVVAAKAPMDIVPAANTARPAGAGALVQLSSQKSEDAARAAYQGLQRRFPSILGNYSPNIQRADLGDRGVYFRVRVGPFSGADATRLCEDLKAAGGDCIIAR